MFVAPQDCPYGAVNDKWIQKFAHVAMADGKSFVELSSAQLPQFLPWPFYQQYCHSGLKLSLVGFHGDHTLSGKTKMTQVLLERKELARASIIEFYNSVFDQDETDAKAIVEATNIGTSFGIFVTASNPCNPKRGRKSKDKSIFALPPCDNPAMSLRCVAAITVSAGDTCQFVHWLAVANVAPPLSIYPTWRGRGLAKLLLSIIVKRAALPSLQEPQAFLLQCKNQPSTEIKASPVRFYLGVGGRQFRLQDDNNRSSVDKRDSKLSKLFTANPLLWVSGDEGNMLLIIIHRYRLPSTPPDAYPLSRKAINDNMSHRYAWFPFDANGGEVELLHEGLPILGTLALDTTRTLDWTNNALLVPSCSATLSGFVSLKCREEYDQSKPNSKAWDSNQMTMMLAWTFRAPCKSCLLIPPAVTSAIQELYEKYNALLLQTTTDSDSESLPALHQELQALFTTGPYCVMQFIYRNMHMFSLRFIFYVVEEEYQRWSLTVAVNAGTHVNVTTSAPAVTHISGLHYINPSQARTATGLEGPPETNAFAWFLDVVWLLMKPHPMESNTRKVPIIPCPLVDVAFSSKDTSLTTIAFKEGAVFVEPGTYANSGLGVILNLSQLLRVWPKCEWRHVNRSVRVVSAHCIVLDPREFGLLGNQWATQLPELDTLSAFRNEYEIFVDRLANKARVGFAAKHKTSLHNFRATMKTPLFNVDAKEPEDVPDAPKGNELESDGAQQSDDASKPSQEKETLEEQPKASQGNKSSTQKSQNTRTSPRRPVLPKAKSVPGNEETGGTQEKKLSGRKEDVVTETITTYPCADRSYCSMGVTAVIGKKDMKCWMCKKPMHAGCGSGFRPLGRGKKPLAKSKLHRRCYYCHNNDVPSDDDISLPPEEGPGIASLAIVEKRRQRLQGLQGIERMMEARSLADNNDEMVDLDESEQDKFVDRQLRVWGWKTQRQFVDWKNNMNDLIQEDIAKLVKRPDAPHTPAHKAFRESLRLTKAHLKEELQHHTKAVKALQQEFLLTRDGIVCGMRYKTSQQLFVLSVAYRSPRRGNAQFNLRINVPPSWILEHYGQEVCDYIKDFSRKQFDGFMPVLAADKKLRNADGEIRLGNNGEPLSLDSIRFLAKSQQWEGKSSATNEVFVLHESECSKELKQAYYSERLTGANDGAFVAIGKDMPSPKVPILDDSPVVAVKYKPEVIVKLPRKPEKGRLTKWEKQEQVGIRRAYTEMGRDDVDPRATGHGFKRKRRPSPVIEEEAGPKSTTRTRPAMWWARLADGNTKIVTEDEIKMLFGDKYTREIMRVGQNTAANGKYIDVPVGAVRSARLHQEHTLVVRNAPIVFHQQKIYDTCVFSSFASALRFAGATDAAATIQRFARKHEGTSAINVYKQLRLTLRKTSVNYLDAQTIPPMFDCLTELKHNMILVGSLQGSDGSVHHSVTIFHGWIFDSNEEKAIPLSKAGLDFCTETEEESRVSGGPTSTFVRFQHGILFVDNTKKNKLTFMKTTLTRRQKKQKNQKKQSNLGVMP